MGLFIRWIISFWRGHVGRLSWPTLLTLVLVHGASVFAILWLFGERDLTQDPITYIYFYFVSISTVGYGDMSPVTQAGQLATIAFLIIPGLGLFGAFLGKFMTTLNQFTRLDMLGENDFSESEDHIILFGWHPQRTRKIVDLILGDAKRKDRRILLCVQRDMEHPLPSYGQVNFIRLESFTDPADLHRTGIMQAARVIIATPEDDQALAVALAVGSLLGDHSQCHISAYFEDASKADLLSAHLPNIECSTNRAAEALTRSMQDPGSSRVFQQLLNTLDGNTQFSLDLPEDAQPLPYQTLFMHLKQAHQATAIGVASSRFSREVELNPELNRQVQPGEVLYYIAPHRIHASEINWQALIMESVS